jgi:catechol-2,3-dioxygenase
MFLFNHGQMEKAGSWKLDSTYFVIVQVEERFSLNGYHRKNVGLNHLAFHAESRADVDSMLLKLRQRGVEILYSSMHPNADGDVYALYFEDPDRIKVEFVASIL